MTDWACIMPDGGLIRTDTPEPDAMACIAWSVWMALLAEHRGALVYQVKLRGRK